MKWLRVLSAVALGSGGVLGALGGGGIAASTRSAFDGHRAIFRAFSQVLQRKPSSAVASTTQPELRLRWYWITLLTALLVLVAGSSVASTIYTLTDQTNLDPALRAIGLIFPDSDHANALTTMVAKFMAILSILAASGLVYHSLLAITAMAESGRFPHRPMATVGFCVAMALLLPGGGGGLNLGQRTVAEAARWSSDTATELWTDFAKATLFVDYEHNGGDLTINVDVGGYDLARGVFYSELCAAWVGQYWPNSDQYKEYMPGEPMPSAPDPVGVTANDGGLSWDWGLCGSIRALPAAGTDEPAEAAFKTARISAIRTMISSLRQSGIVERAVTSFMAIGADGPTQWPGDGELLAAIGPAAQGYNASMNAAARIYMAKANSQALTNAVDAVEQRGWTAAGALWRTISAANEAVYHQASLRPSYVKQSDDYVAMGKKEPDPQHDAFGWLSLKARIDQQLVREERRTELAGDDLAAAGDKRDNLLAKLLNPLTRPVAELLADSLSTNDADPVGSSMSEGHKLINIVDTAWLAGAGVAVAAKNTAADMAGIDGAFDWAASFVKPFLWIAYTIGVVHAYIIPLIPYVSVVFAGVNWMIALVEALLAMPIICVLASRLDSDGLIHQVARPGLLIIGNIVFLPIYTVFALASTYYLLPPALQIVDGTFSAAFTGAQGGFTMEVGGLLAVMATKLYLDWMIMNRVFSVVHEIPNRLLKYFGLSGELTDARGHSGFVGVVGGGGGLPGPGAGGGGGGRKGGRRGGSLGGSGGGRGGLPGISKVPGAGGGGGSSGGGSLTPSSWLSGDAGGGASSGGGVSGGGAPSGDAGGGGGFGGGGDNTEADIWFNRGSVGNLSQDDWGQVESAYEKWCEERASKGKPVGDDFNVNKYAAWAIGRQNERRGGASKV
ncbi:DotA/TraY family protein [Radicibacter daui]|uniref:DotA/TraY family protein n=1 Tax=Radicibacter daui TaxID=3064829 RepID=UPI004046BC7A